MSAITKKKSSILGQINRFPTNVILQDELIKIKKEKQQAKERRVVYNDNRDLEFMTYRVIEDVLIIDEEKRKK